MIFHFSRKLMEFTESKIPNGISGFRKGHKWGENPLGKGGSGKTGGEMRGGNFFCLSLGFEPRSLV